MGAGHVPELCSAVLDPTFGLMHLGGPRVLTQRGNDLSAADPDGKDLRAAKAVIACMFSQRILRAWRYLFLLRSKVYRWLKILHLPAVVAEIIKTLGTPAYAIKCYNR